MLRAITRLNIGGPAIHAILLTQGLQHGRFRTLLVSGQEAAGEGNLRDLADRCGVRPVMVDELGRELSLRNDLAAVGRLYRLIKRERPAIVHTHMAKAGTTARLAARLAGVPIVVHTYHGHVFHSYFGPRKTALFLSIERFLGRLTDRIVAVGETQRRELIGYGVAPASKIVSIPLGLDIEPMLRAEQYRGRLREELGLNGVHRLVGIVARLVPVKAHDVFLEAAVEVRQAIPQTRFLIVGDGERRADLERRSRELGLADAAHFLGWRRDMRSVYADLDVVVLSSLNEGSPVAIIEAMAAGRPVVATRVGGVSEVVEHGRSGLLVPPRDSASLAAAIRSVLQSESLADALGGSARASVYPRYAAARLIGDVERMYLDLARRKGLAA